jgi:hypothetical protein
MDIQRLSGAIAVLVGLLVTGLLVCSSAFAAERLKSSLQAGEKITTIFEPVNITGEHAGEPYCLICENGLAPVAMLFAREVNEPLLKLLAKLDEAAVRHRDQELGSFVVFLSDEAELPKQLAAAAKQRGFQRIVLSTYSPAGPDGFHVAKDADLTVVLYREHDVKANHAFRRGELTESASDKILADLPKILTKK